MFIVIVAATQKEVADIKKELKLANNIKTAICIAGVGMLANATCISHIIFKHKPDLIIQVGIAGCFDKKINLGTTMLVQQEMYGDLGVNENGVWKDVFDLKLQKINDKPFNKKAIVNPHIKGFNTIKLPLAKAITVNQITTDKNQINQLIQKYNPVLESMEGMALHFVCTLFGTKFLQIRSVSNYIGERDKTLWNIKLALDNLTTHTVNLIHSIS
jgi:futalosine hydrolase